VKKRERVNFGKTRKRREVREAVEVYFLVLR
jgi:hypothetical protein